MTQQILCTSPVGAVVALTTQTMDGYYANYFDAGLGYKSEMRLLRDGRLQVRNGASYMDVTGEYIESGATSTIGDNYEAEVHVVYGSAPGANGATSEAADTYIRINTELLWATFDTMDANLTGRWRVRIRDYVTKVQVAEATFVVNF